MTSVFLAPVDDSFERVVADTADLTDWPDRPADFPPEARVWGVRTDTEQGDWPRNRRNWRKMAVGDAVLFYDSGTYVAAGRVGAKCEDPWVRDRFWDAGPAVSVFTVEDYISDLSLSIEEVNQILGYAENYYPRGLRRVADDRPTERLLQRVGLD